MEEDIEDDPFMGMEDSFPSDITGDGDECFRARKDDHKEGIWYTSSSGNMDGGSQDSPPQQNKKVRGICKMKQVTRARKEGEKLQIGWNSRGQPINPNKSKFTYFVGYATRSTVPIIYSDWGQVPIELKNHISDQVQ
ncbi:hypothetical protein SESBI_35486, partial [Sesbania bispinosa]